MGCAAVEADGQEEVAVNVTLNTNGPWTIVNKGGAVGFEGVFARSAGVAHPTTVLP